MSAKFNIKSEKELPETAVSFKSMLENKTSSWRNIKPVIDEDKCIKCMICWKYCPDIAIEIKDQKPAINYDYCKGCGICSTECPKKAIEMVGEER